MQVLPGCRLRDAGPGLLGREHRACTYSHKLGLIGFSRQQKEEVLSLALPSSILEVVTQNCY